MQINESSDPYHPKVFHGMKKEFNRDIMLEIYEVFRTHWDNGNKWMLHILTKSHLITEHLDVLKSMRDMVQVEISICSPDNDVIWQFEKETPILDKRLHTIKQLSDAGIFVRVMAMPFVDTRDDALELRDMCFNAGAKGFKHKGLNYFTMEDQLQLTAGRIDEAWEDLNVMSGEFVEDKRVDVLWSDSLTRRVRVVNCGYAELNSVDWGYVV